VSDRDVRHFLVFKDTRLVLEASATPGTLRSTAGPPALPSGPPGPPGPPGTDALPPGVHPFIDAQAHDPGTEGELRALLDESSDFDDYLQRLLAHGYEIVSALPSEGIDYELAAGPRLQGSDGVVGGAWPQRGQFTTLEHQPAEGELVFDHATVTAYSEAAAPQLLEALEHSDGFEELLDRLAAAGIASA